MSSEKMSYGSIAGSGGLGSRGPFGGPSQQGYQPLGKGSVGVLGSARGRSPLWYTGNHGNHRRILSF